jgi:hypothetical protein
MKEGTRDGKKRKEGMNRRETRKGRRMEGRPTIQLVAIHLYPYELRQVSDFARNFACGRKEF